MPGSLGSRPLQAHGRGGQVSWLPPLRLPLKVRYLDESGAAARFRRHQTTTSRSSGDLNGGGSLPTQPTAYRPALSRMSRPRVVADRSTYSH